MTSMSSEEDVGGDALLSVRGHNESRKIELETFHTDITRENNGRTQNNATGLTQYIEAEVVKKAKGKRRKQPAESYGPSLGALTKIDVRIEGIQYIAGNQVFPNSIKPKSNTFRKSTSMDF